MSTVIETPPRSAGATLKTALASPWVRKPVYFVLTVVGVALGLVRVLLMTLFEPSDEKDDEFYEDLVDSMNTGAERMKIAPTSLGVGFDPEANEAYPGLFAAFLAEQDYKYWEEKRQSGPFAD